jgi:nicotinamide-nucleotide amidase
MKAEVITSGTELLLGEITDTNTPFIAGRLAELGIDLYYTSAVGDNFARYSGLLRQAWDRSDIIFTTGGLGPTRGDITREVIAGLLGEKMAVVPELKERLVAIFRGRGIEMQRDGKTIVALPGPPIELQDMWRQEVQPRLEARSGAVILSRTLKTWGMSEGRVDELLAPFLDKGDPTLGIYARYDGIHLRITAKTPTRAAAAEKVTRREAEIRQILGERIWGADADTLEGVVGGLLASLGLSLATAETFTAGRLAQSLAEDAGCSGCFRGGVLLPGSGGGEEGALEMAASARRQFAADIGIAIGGGGEHIFIAVDSGARSRAIEASFPGGAQQVIRRAVTHALVFLRDFLQEQRQAGDK